MLRWIVGNGQSGRKIMVGDISSQFPPGGGGGEAGGSTASRRSSGRLFGVSGLPSDQLWCPGSEGKFDAVLLVRRSRHGRADQDTPRAAREVVPPTSRFSVALVVTSCRSRRTASTSTVAPAIRAACTVTASTAAEPDATRHKRGCPSCSAQSLWEARNSRQRTIMVVGATKTTRRLWVLAGALTSATREARESTC